MNYRRASKVCAGCILLMFGFAAFMVETNSLGFGMFVASFVIFLLLCRKTRRDEEYMRRYEAGELFGQVVRKSFSEGSEKEPSTTTEDERLKRTLVGATALHVAAGPFIVLGKLLKMQK